MPNLNNPTENLNRDIENSQKSSNLHQEESAGTYGTKIDEEGPVLSPHDEIINQHSPKKVDKI